MRAIRVHGFGDPSVMVVEDVPTPEPGPGQVLVKVHAAGVNPVETYIRSGRYGALPTLPYTPGSDGAGLVVGVGGGANVWKAGDRVFFHGTAASQAGGSYADLAVCEAHQVYRLPAHIGFSEGAAVGVPYATAYVGLFVKAAAKTGEIVLVHGASGGVGTAALQLARWKGLKVIGTAGSPDGLELVRANGAHFAVGHREALYLDQIKAAANNGRGPDIILEMLANENLDHDFDVVALRGRIVIIGNRGRIEIDPRKIMAKDLTITGVFLWGVGPEQLASVYADIGIGLEQRALVPVIGQEIPLGEAPRAHEVITGGRAYGKIVLVP